MSGARGQRDASATDRPGDPARARLAWRCRRGMKELDLLLEGYLAARFEQADEAERALFASLLALPDPELARHLLGGELPADPALAGLVEAIRERRGYYVR